MSGSPCCGAILRAVYGLLDSRANDVSDLSILITDPAHGRRGAGGLLIKWGVDEAKKYNLPLFVESSRKGHELYGKYGFKDLECHELDLSKWGAKEPHRTWAMVIEPDEAR